MADEGHILTEQKLSQLEENIRREYEKATNDMRAKLEAYLEKTEAQRKVQESLLKDGKITKQEYKDWCYRHAMIGKRWEEMQQVLADDLKHADKIAKSMMKKSMPDIYALNCNYATYRIEHDAEIDTGFTLYNHDTAEYLLGDQRQLMPQPSTRKAAQIKANADMQWNKNHIQSAVLQGVLQGESPYDVAKRLQQVGQMSYNSAVRYARTMTTSAQNAGRYESFHRAKDLGVDLTIEWQATLDHRTRHAHRMMHGQRTEVDKPFYTPDGYTIYYPADCTGESNAPQKEIWNCRCTLLAWVKGYEGDTVKDSPKMGDMTFEEWQNEKSDGFTNENIPAIISNKDRVIQNAQEFSYREHEQMNFNRDFWDNTLTESERYSVRRYTSNAYRYMNRELRGKSKHTEDDTIQMIKGAESALSKCTIAKDTILYRGMGEVSSLADAMGISEFELREAVADNSIVGMRFCEKGFSSTGVAKADGWDKPVQMTIYTPEGTNGMYVDLISQCRGERELLLQHHTWYEIEEAYFDMDDHLQMKVFVFDQTPEDYKGTV